MHRAFRPCAVLPVNDQRDVLPSGTMHTADAPLNTLTRRHWKRRRKERRIPRGCSETDVNARFNVQQDSRHLRSFIPDVCSAPPPPLLGQPCAKLSRNAEFGRI